jgi:hypothetical protein
MSDKRMMIVPAEIVNKINENRGDLSQAEFIEFLINDQLGQDKPAELKNTTSAEIDQLRKEISSLCRMSKPSRRIRYQGRSGCFPGRHQETDEELPRFLYRYGLEFNKKSEGKLIYPSFPGRSMRSKKPPAKKAKK